MGRSKGPGEMGTKKRKELEREEAQEHHANAAAPQSSLPGELQQQQQQPMTFMQHDFGLDRRLVKAVAKMGFVYPTLVQNKCIPLALKGKDLLVGIVPLEPGWSD